MFRGSPSTRPNFDPGRSTSAELVRHRQPLPAGPPQRPIQHGVRKPLRRLNTVEMRPVDRPDDAPPDNFLDGVFDRDDGHGRAAARRLTDDPADDGRADQRPDAVMDQDDVAGPGPEPRETAPDRVLTTAPSPDDGRDLRVAPDEPRAVLFVGQDEDDLVHLGMVLERRPASSPGPVSP